MTEGERFAFTALVAAARVETNQEAKQQLLKAALQPAQKALAHWASRQQQVGVGCLHTCNMGGHWRIGLAWLCAALGGPHTHACLRSMHQPMSPTAWHPLSCRCPAVP